VDEALSGAVDGGSWSHFAWYALLFAAGAAIGLMSLVYYDGWMKRKRDEAMLGPGAASAAEFEQSWVGSLSASAWLSLLIATGIGLHNFSEGLAIGQSAAAGKVSLAVLLIIGFGLHNATEGFGIVAPLAADVDEDGRSRTPSWRFLLTLGLIGGGPTFVGTVIGHGFTNEALSVVFLTLAAGSILYVVIQLLGVAAKARRPELLAAGLTLGLLAGFATDAIVTAAGA